MARLIFKKNGFREKNFTFPLTSRTQYDILEPDERGEQAKNNQQGRRKMKKGIQTKMEKAAEKRLSFELASLKEWTLDGFPEGYELPTDTDIEADIYDALTDEELDEVTGGYDEATPEYKEYSDSLVTAILKKIQDARK